MPQKKTGDWFLMVNKTYGVIFSLIIVSAFVAAVVFLGSSMQLILYGGGYEVISSMILSDHTSLILIGLVLGFNLCFLTVLISSRAKKKLACRKNVKDTVDSKGTVIGTHETVKGDV